MLAQRNERAEGQDSLVEPLLGQVSIDYIRNEQRNEEGKIL